jgi:hypothetical protein
MLSDFIWESQVATPRIMSLNYFLIGYWDRGKYKQITTKCKQIQANTSQNQQLQGNTNQIQANTSQ